MGHTLATMRGAEEGTKRNRKRDLWERIKRNITRSGVSEKEAAKVMKSIRRELNELIEIEGVEQYVCGHHDGMQKAKSQLHTAPAADPFNFEGMI